MPAVRPACKLTAWLVFGWTLIAAFGLASSWPLILDNMPGTIEDAELIAFKQPFVNHVPYREILLKFHESWAKGWFESNIRLAEADWTVSFRSSDGIVLAEVKHDEFRGASWFRNGELESQRSGRLDARLLADWVERTFPTAQDQFVESDCDRVLMEVKYRIDGFGIFGAPDSLGVEHGRKNWESLSIDFSDLPQLDGIGTRPSWAWLGLVVISSVCLWLLGSTVIVLFAYKWLKDAIV